MLNPKTIQQDKYREVRDHQRLRDTKLGDQPGPLVITAMNISDFPMIFPTLWYKTKKKFANWWTSPSLKAVDFNDFYGPSIP